MGQKNNFNLYHLWLTMTRQMNFVTSCRYQHDTLGIVQVTVRANALHIRARWSKGCVHVTVPPHTTIDYFNKAINELVPKLVKIRPERSGYYFGQEITTDNLIIRIQPLDADDSYIHSRFISENKGTYTFEISAYKELDLNKENAMTIISTQLKEIARKVAPTLLLPRAEKLAAHINRIPSDWRISTGRRILGKCDSKGVISLSCMVVFLPQHLRDYIIYHELAHLSEMNHSVKFHQLCNAYCNGKERQYIAELKNFKFPVID
jgi:predicted metal-dependent hydrolase